VVKATGVGGIHKVAYDHYDSDWVTAMLRILSLAITIDQNDQNLQNAKLTKPNQKIFHTSLTKAKANEIHPK
jgi:hypothetical protein